MKNGNIHPTRIFKTPDDLLTAWNEYKADLKEQANEWLRVQYVGKEGERKADPQKVPYTLEGFKRFCRENYGEVHHYFVNTDNLYDDFCTICSRIREEIRENQLIGGLLNFYNPSITARLNNLIDKQELDHTTKGDKINTQWNLKDATPEQIEALAALTGITTEDK